ncbi:MAG: hypothetical protein ACRD0C_01915 [Acidimicrobiia bacterium]
MIGMDGMILAHNGGLDELAMLLFPFIVGGGVWMMTRQPKKPKPSPDGGEVRSIREPRQPQPPRQRWGGKKSTS